jgi:hypothetical protein
VLSSHIVERVGGSYVEGDVWCGRKDARRHLLHFLDLKNVENLESYMNIY